VHRQPCDGTVAQCASHLCPIVCPALTMLLVLQVFCIRYNQELRLRNVSGTGIEQQEKINHEPAHQPPPGPAGATLDAHGDSVHLKAVIRLDRSPGMGC